MGDQSSAPVALRPLQAGMSRRSSGIETAVLMYLYRAWSLS
jgi:hypothetical protein